MPQHGRIAKRMQALDSRYAFRRFGTNGAVINFFVMQNISVRFPNAQPAPARGCSKGLGCYPSKQKQLSRLVEL